MHAKGSYNKNELSFSSVDLKLYVTVVISGIVIQRIHNQAD